MKRWLIHHAVTAAVLLAGLGIVVYAGWYNIGADSPHWPLTYKVLEVARTRAVEARAADVQVPRLDDPQLILKGAGQYAAMCVNCHLAPGMQQSELRVGLCPQPPNLSKMEIDPKNAFWVTKHGIKMSAMPAWGKGHDDATLWSIVAFVTKLPSMTPQAYNELVAKAPADEEMAKSMPSMGKGASSDHDQTPHGHGAKPAGVEEKKEAAGKMGNMPGMH